MKNPQGEGIMGLAFQGISEHSVPTLLDLLYQVSQSHSSCTLPIR